MKISTPTAPFGTAQCVRAYPATALVVRLGANQGDSLDLPDLICPGDVYRLDRDAVLHDLDLWFDDAGTIAVAGGTVDLPPGTETQTEALVTFMARFGETVEAVLLGDGGRRGAAALVPLSPMQPGEDYTLVAIDREAGRHALTLPACGGVAAETAVLAGDGSPVAAGALAVGDSVRTAGSGAQPLRWIGRRTVRAFGELAPVTIAAGVLGNEAALTLAPETRLAAGPGGAMLPAASLCGRPGIRRAHGGWVDYVHLLLDTPDRIFAGALEIDSLTLDGRTRAWLPEPLRTTMPMHVAAEVETRHVVARHS